MMLEDAWKNWLAGAAAVLCGVLIWFAGPLFRISGADLRFTQSAIGVVGISGIGTFLWTRLRTRRKQPPASTATPDAGAQVKRLLRDADERLSSLSQKKWTSMRQMPVLLIVRASEGGPASITAESDLRTDELCGGTDPATSVTGHLHGDTVLLEVSRP